MKLQVSKLLFLLSSLLLTIYCDEAGSEKENILAQKIDSILQTGKPFNGIILITKNGNTEYEKVSGYADLESKKPLELNSQFVIGSISKQIAAVLVLQEFEKGTIHLNDTISKYLLDIKMPWADSITVHHLLTHTHGIEVLDKPLKFKPGSQFAYSQLGFQLLADILEKVKEKSFIEISTNLFAKCEMTNTFHPKNKKYDSLVKGYVENDGNLEYTTESLVNYVPAGCFISTVNDLAKWNTLLYNGKLLSDSTYKLMSTRYATRQHPIFDEVEYGYGLLFNKGESKIKIGAFGYASGFVSSNYYFPETKTSVIILSNIARDLDDFKKSFYYQTTITDLVKDISNKNHER